MHNFSELSHSCAVFTLKALDELHQKTTEALQTSGATSLVKTLQMIRLEKAILAIGMFSIFDAILQDRLNCKNGFTEAKNILNDGGETELLEQFTDFELAINALKHGKGKSYNQLITKGSTSIDATIKNPEEQFFFEGDISEISGLVEVNDAFVENCALIIAHVSRVIQKLRPGIYF